MLRAFRVAPQFVWFILALLPAAASDEGIPHALRSILMLPPALILAALGGVWLYNLMKNHWGRNIAHNVAAIFLISVAVFAYVDYFVVWAQEPERPGRLQRRLCDRSATRSTHFPRARRNMSSWKPAASSRAAFPCPPKQPSSSRTLSSREQQEAKNIHYLLPDQTNQIPPGHRYSIFNSESLPDKKVPRAQNHFFVLGATKSGAKRPRLNSGIFSG